MQGEFSIHWGVVIFLQLGQELAKTTGKWGTAEQLVEGDDQLAGFSIQQIAADGEHEIFIINLSNVTQTGVAVGKHFTDWELT